MQFNDVKYSVHIKKTYESVTINKIYESIIINKISAPLNCKQKVLSVLIRTVIFFNFTMYFSIKGDNI